MSQQRALTCEEALRRVGVRSKKCCKRCHHHSRFFIFKLDDRTAAVCCDVALLLLTRRADKKTKTYVEVEFDPVEVADMLRM